MNMLNQETTNNLASRSSLPVPLSLGNLPLGDLRKVIGEDIFAEYIAKLSQTEAEDLFYTWKYWARNEQLTPGGDWWSIWLLLAGRGFGKALALDTPIMTSLGWKSIGRLESGDWLFDDRGESCSVVKLHETLYDRDCFKITFSNGDMIICDSEHLWRTEISQDRSINRLGSIKTTQDISETKGELEAEHSITIPNSDRIVFFSKIEKLEQSVPVRCITVDSPSGLYCAGHSMIPTHNTRTGAEWIKERVANGKARYIALVSQSAADARDVLIEGEAGILSIYPKSERPLYEPSKRRITWDNGAQATIYTAEDPDQLRGPSHDTAWADELAVYRNMEDVWSNLMLGLRLGDSKCLVSTTPKPVKLIRELVKREGQDTFVTRGKTRDNFNNLSKTFLNQIITKYEGTRLGRQELDGEILEEIEGALWNRDILEKCRIKNNEKHKVPELKKIVVAIDPTVAIGENATETGIIVAGLGVDNEGYILSDRTLQASPDGWAKASILAYNAYDANKIVAERNNGGEMVRLTIQSQTDKRGRNVGRNIKIKLVWASRGKMTRAEPVSALYEQNRVHHIGIFDQLEDELCTYDGEGESPNRLDALVWAITDLMLDTPFSQRLVFGRRVA